MNRPLVPLVLAACVGITLAGFTPAVRVDRENRPSYACYHADIAVGPALGGTEPVYVAFENDSVPFLVERSDIRFQRSIDGGQTWLSEDVLIRRGDRYACYPDIATGPDGTVHLLYTDRLNGSIGHIHSVRSTDGGTTWSAPVQVDDNLSRVAIGWSRLAIDSAGNLFCTWTDKRGSYLRVYSDVSTDGGNTWSDDVRVDDDTVSFNCYPPDCFIQPGTNHYLVVAVAPVRQAVDRIVLHSHFYKSTDMGATFSPGFQLDTFDGYCQQPHVVADEDYIITDYTGDGHVNQSVTMARTARTPGDSWGPQVMVTELDTTHSSFTNGAKLAIDPQRNVHTALMICDRRTFVWGIFHARSTDHGYTWSAREEVSDIDSVAQWDPNIAVDTAGHAYVVWQDMRNDKAEIWFSTNNLTGLAEGRAAPHASRPALRVSPSPFTHSTTIRLSGPLAVPVSRVLVFDATGRCVRKFPASDIRRDASLTWDGADATGQRCPAGVYIIRVDVDDHPPPHARVILLAR